MSYDRNEVTSKTLDMGYRVAVEYDRDPENPQKAWDNVGIVVLLDRARYDFGDERADEDELRAIANDPENIVLPIYIYDHSGITINTTGFSCKWDSGMVGLIYCTKAQAIKEWGKKILTKQAREAAVRYLKGQIETLDSYLTGQVYGFVVYDPEGNEVESCWGFYGEEDYCLKEGIASAEHFIKEAKKERIEADYWALRDVPTQGACHA